MKRRIILAFLVSFFSAESFAELYCDEEIVELRLHETGAIDFKTRKTCSDSWCRVSTWGTEESRNQAFSMLLTAKSQSKKVRIWWRPINSCDEQTPPGTQPASIGLFE